MARGCFISTGRSLPAAIERVKLAESLGYESVYVTHIAGRESLTVLTAYALATGRIRLGTGVVPIYTRTPATMAQTAATLDELSDGRLTLGLGVSHRPVVEGWHGQTIDRPVAEMREYAMIVRAILRGEDPPSGHKWQTGFHLISDGFLAELTAVGDEGQLLAGVERYRDAGAGSPCIGPIPGTDFEATLRAGAA